VDIEDLAAIRGIKRARCDGEIHGGIHVEPPKKFRAGELRFQVAHFLPEFAAMNQVYAQFFGSDKPARTTVEAVLLAADMKIEIDCVAYAPIGR